tara:strand:+ start:198 stop:719 length:522 start_codon:yes stop_codon:yes gene_type:complete
MKPNKIKIDKILSSPNNPRLIKDFKFKKLMKSIQDFPEMLKLRPIIVDENWMILGGNMRYKACLELGHKTVWAVLADDLTEDQKKQFVIKDNVGFGEWDWDMLANGWENDKLNDWGMDVWNEDVNLDDFFEEAAEQKEETKNELEWHKDFVDYIQANHNNAYNEACEYADNKE